jgi:hypothetical protein
MTERSLDAGWGDPAWDRSDGTDRTEFDDRMLRQVIPQPTEWLAFIDAIKAQRCED